MSGVKEVKTKTKVNRLLFVEDLFFLMGYAAVIWILSGVVHSKLSIIYWIFSGVMALVMILPSHTNKKRKLWQALFIYLRKSFSYYRPILNLSCKPKRERNNNEKR